MSQQMNLSEKKEYGMALVRGADMLDVVLLKKRISAIRNDLKKQHVQQHDKVVLLVSDDTFRLPAMWALLLNNITCVLAIPGPDENGFQNIVKQYPGAYILADQKHPSFFNSSKVIITGGNEETDSMVEEEINNAEKSIPFIVYAEQKERIITQAELDEFFNELDRCVSPSGKDCMLLADCIPYSRKALEMVWASSRGLTLVTGDLNEQFDFSKHTQDAGHQDMKFSLFYFGSYMESSEKNKYKLLFDTVQFADKNDFSAVWTPERHFNEFGGLYPNPSVLSSAIAVSTSRVQIRSGSLVSPLHHAARIAEDWALIDNLSDGRVGISFASGWQCDDFIFFPENYPQRHEYMLQQIDTVKRLWGGEKVNFRNGLNKEIQVAIFPKPVQKELPVWITVSGKTETFIDAGKMGANILTHLLWQDPDQLIEKIAEYRKSLRENGFDPYSRTVSIMVHTFLGENIEDVKNKVREPLKNYIRSSTQLIQSMAKSNADSADSKEIGGRYGTIDSEIPEHLMNELAEIAFARFFDQAGLLGTVEKSKEMIMRLKKYDVDEVACLIDFGLKGEEIKESLVHLNELRKLYDRKAASFYPVTITHCSLQTAENYKAGFRLADYFSTQKVIVVETDSFDKIQEAKPLSGKIQIMYDEDRGNDLKVCLKKNEYSDVPTDALFNETISEDF
jgi:natural product biosynthesis luciferase-like monooxygenase protein